MLSWRFSTRGGPRSLAAVKYNERVAECGRAVAAISLTRPIEALRDATVGDLPVAMANGLDDIAFRRARHVISENQRVLEFADAMARDDLETLGDICARSHESLKSDYEVTVPETRCNGARSAIRTWLHRRAK